MRKSLFALSVLAVFAAQAGIMDRPSGIKIGQRMTIRPYVALYYTWDSNVDSANSQRGSSSFNINPGLTLTYMAENWSIQGGAYYQYHAYTSNERNLNQGSWGENLAFNWSNSKDGGRGWSLVLSENIQMISQDDDMTNDGGRGMGRDRFQMQFAGDLQRRFTDRWHADINASYYYLKYDNNPTQYAPMYGWTRWTAGAQAGYVASKWTDILVMGNYQGYTQGNDTDMQYWEGPTKGKDISNNSEGYTVHLGLGTHATKKISYRVTGGYSSYRYGGGAYTSGGFTYGVSGQWRMNDTWNMMLLASSYYAPSETEYGSACRTDSISWGLAHSMIRNKLTATFDLSYRHQTSVYAERESSENTYNYITARLGLSYAFNRFISIFGHAEYQKSLSDGTVLDRYDCSYDYDRWRLSVGLRLTY